MTEAVKKYVIKRIGKKRADEEFSIPKRMLYWFYLFAEDNPEYALKIIKVTKTKCIEKIFKGYPSLMVSKWATWRNYNDNLEHRNGKIKIMDFELVKE